LENLTKEILLLYWHLQFNKSVNTFSHAKEGASQILDRKPNCKNGQPMSMK